MQEYPQESQGVVRWVPTILPRVAVDPSFCNMVALADTLEAETVNADSGPTPVKVKPWLLNRK